MYYVVYYEQMVHVCVKGTKSLSFDIILVIFVSLESYYMLFGFVKDTEPSVFQNCTLTLLIDIAYKYLDDII